MAPHTSTRRRCDVCAKSVNTARGEGRVRGAQRRQGLLCAPGIHVALARRRARPEGLRRGRPAGTGGGGGRRRARTSWGKPASSWAPALLPARGHRRCRPCSVCPPPAARRPLPRWSRASGPAARGPGRVVARIRGGRRSPAAGRAAPKRSPSWEDSDAHARRALEEDAAADGRGHHEGSRRCSWPPALPSLLGASADRRPLSRSSRASGTSNPSSSSSSPRTQGCISPGDGSGRRG